MKLYVVSFTPAAEELSSVGGWEWRYSLKDAEAVYDRMLTEQEEHGDTHILRLVEVEVPDQIRTVAEDSKRRDVIEFYLEQYEEDFETNLPALREHIPSSTNPDWRPIGGIAS